MSPTAKLVAIRDMCENALNNTRPMATLLEISRIAGLLDDDHEWQRPATPVFQTMREGEPCCWTFDKVPHPNHIPTQEQHCRDNPPALHIPEPAVDQLKLWDNVGEAIKARQQTAWVRLTKQAS